MKGGGRGICPMGWHIPTDREWAELLDSVEGNGEGNIFINQPALGTLGSDAGLKLKSAATFTGTTDPGNGSWVDDPNRGLDTYQFCLLPSGWRGPNGMLNRGWEWHSWSSSVGSKENAWYRGLRTYNAGMTRWLFNRWRAYSIRCVRQ
jgi:uncharacterized protein (TIGR02145 family)